jgi:hypothetical protein
MSQYIDFFVRVNDSFAPVGTWGNSSTVYRLFEDAVPYGRIKPITIEDLKTARVQLQSLIAVAQKDITKLEHYIELAAAAQLSLEDKMEQLEYLENNIMVCNEEEDEYKGALGYVEALIHILDTIEYSEHFSYQKYIYVGIEVGETPGVKDIEGI